VYHRRVHVILLENLKDTAGGMESGDVFAWAEEN
jgi:hypothetical protein